MQQAVAEPATPTREELEVKVSDAQTIHWNHSAWPLGLAVLLMFLTLTSPIAWSDGAPSAEPDQAAAETTTFSPEIEEKLKKFFDKAAEACRKQLSARVAKCIADVQTVTGLEAEKAKALDGPAAAAVDLTMAEWSTRFPSDFREQWRQQIPLSIDVMLQQAELYAGTSEMGADEYPEDKPAWNEGLQHVLTPAQYTLWTQTVEARRQAKHIEINKYLDDQKDQVLDNIQQPMQRKAAEMKAALGLPKVTADRLEDLAKTLAHDTVKHWRESVEKRLLSLPEDTLRQMLKGGRVYFGVELKVKKAQDHGWETGLARELSPEQMKSWQDLQDESRARRVQGYTLLLLSELDRQIAFTARQREKLEPLATRLVEKEPNLVPGNFDANNYYFGSTYVALFSAAAKADRAQLGAILDVDQLKHWYSACEVGRKAMNESDTNGPGASGESSDAPASPEEVESYLSDFFLKKVGAVRESIVAELTSKAEDASRTAALPPERMRRLRIAARGAADSSFQTWADSVEQNARNALHGGKTTADVAVQLRNFGSYNFTPRNVQAGELARWSLTVDAEMTAAQRAAWQVELDARARYLDAAIAKYVVARFDGIVGLTQEQWARFEPLVTRFLADYREDLTNFSNGFFFDNMRLPWYLQYYSLLPLASLSDKELAASLTKEQADAWMASNDCSNCSSMWQNVRQQHEQRVKQNK